MKVGFFAQRIRRLACSGFPYQRQDCRSLNIFSIFSKDAVEKERLRLKDELNRGYFDDYRDLKKHGGKLEMASQCLLPAVSSVQFPTLMVEMVSGQQLTLPSGQKISEEKAESSAPILATLVCVSFRANGQGLVKSWILPFINSFKARNGVKIFEVSYIDSWFLSLTPVRRLLLRSMESSKTEGQNDDGMRQIVYAFGDSYDFRRAIHITNLLTGYIFLLDKHGKIRWRAYGQSTNEEISSMISFTLELLDEQKDDA